MSVSDLTILFSGSACLRIFFSEIFKSLYKLGYKTNYLRISLIIEYFWGFTIMNNASKHILVPVTINPNMSTSLD